MFANALNAKAAPVADDIALAVQAPVQPVRGACPKCGKKIGRGIAMHMKHCKGIGP